MKPEDFVGYFIKNIVRGWKEELNQEGRIMKSKNYKFIRIEPADPMSIFYEVLTRRRREVIGEIFFYRDWKQWVLQAKGTVVWNNQCLRDVTDYLDALNKAEPNG